MTGPEHKREAERLLDAMPDCQCERSDCEHEYALLQRAQIHATLATVPVDDKEDAALTGDVYRLPAGELSSETPLCPAKATGGIGGEWQCTLAVGHDGSHEAHGAHPLPVWDSGGVLRYEQEYEVGKR